MYNKNIATETITSIPVGSYVKLDGTNGLMLCVEADAEYIVAQSDEVTLGTDLARKTFKISGEVAVSASTAKDVVVWRILDSSTLA